MSRGFGQLRRELQREILEHLEDPIPAHNGNFAHETMAYGVAFIPGANVYDLREVSSALAKLHGCRVSNKQVFNAAFSRAIAALVDQRLLEPLRLVPIAEVRHAWDKARQCSIEHLADGQYLRWRSKHVRFVRRLAGKPPSNPD